MSTTRPIPISRDNSRRGSPTSSTASTGVRLDASPVNGISHSCPVAHGELQALASRYPPPRAPIIGSLPEPSGFQMAPMPELVLPPPAHYQEPSPPTASVVQFASSCPGDLGYLREGNQPVQRSWTPSPRTLDEFDLSKSPALAVMSAMRDGRPPLTQASRSSGSSSTRSRQTRRFFSTNESSTPATTIADSTGRHLDVSSDARSDPLLNTTLEASLSSLATHDRGYRYQGSDLKDGGGAALSSDARWSHSSDDRRGSDSSVTREMENLDLCDANAGVFHFEEQ